MREPIKTTPEELAELLAICHENIRIADMTDARHIYDQYITKYGANRDTDYTAVVALGTLYRTGYILGQRSERTRRNAHTEPLAGSEQRAFENGLKLGAISACKRLSQLSVKFMTEAIACPVLAYASWKAWQ